MAGLANSASDATRASSLTEYGKSTEVDQIMDLFSAGGFALVFGLAGMLLMIWPAAAAGMLLMIMAVFAAGRREGNSGKVENTLHKVDSRTLLSSFHTPVA
jgi:hypothetical protein